MTYPNSDSQSFTYDAMGNRLSTTFNSSTTNYTYDAADEMTAAGATSYGYDANGNQTGRGSDTFGYDHQNRLTSTSLGGTSGSYAYNGDGLRTSRTLGGSTVSYSWDQAAALPQVLQDSAGNTYVYGLDLISKTDSGGSQQYYLCDGLGSTTGLTDGSGTVVATYQYDVYGAIRSQSGGSGNEFTFTGEQNDPTGLEYLRARYYDPATGRFLTQDALPLLQRYPYVGSNPANLTDPLGLCGLSPTSWGDCAGDAVECGLNGFDCADPRRVADPLIEMLPEGRLPFGPHLSYQLLATCVQYPEACAAGADATGEALFWTTVFFGAPFTPEGTKDNAKEGDAFTHCLWSGLITLDVGAGKAKRVTTRFEAYAGNLTAEREYDIENNTRGREFAQRIRHSPGARAALISYCR